jgi:hypothetical protein
MGIPQKRIDGWEDWVSQTDFQGPVSGPMAQQ